MDDPLRVIRCVRFASRFSFTLDTQLRQCASDPQIQVGQAFLYRAFR